MAEPSSNRCNQKWPSNALNSTLAALQVQQPTMQVYPEASTAFALTKVPVELELGNDAYLKAIAKTYERLWMECQDCYIFEMDEKHEVGIDQLDFTPPDWTIRAYES